MDQEGWPTLEPTDELFTTAAFQAELWRGEGLRWIT